MDTRTDRIVELPDEQYLKQRVDDKVEALYHELAGNLKPVNIPLTPRQRATMKIGRNDLCLCGSGIKYKKCCRGK